MVCLKRDMQVVPHDDPCYIVPTPNLRPIAGKTAAFLYDSRLHCHVSSHESGHPLARWSSTIETEMIEAKATDKILGLDAISVPDTRY